MDPSEFEGTVEKTDEVLHAGRLEELFSGLPKFIHMDLTKEAGDVYLSIFNLQKLQPASINTLVGQMDEQALELADLKEDYLKRRKALTARVKAFSQTHMQSPSTTPTEVQGTSTNLLGDCTEVVELFKKEFDNLSSLAKFSEAAFLSAYKLMRELPDTTKVVQSALSACLKLEEVMKRAQEQLNTADTLLKKQSDEEQAGVGALGFGVGGGQGGGGGGGVGDTETLRIRYEHDKEQQLQKHLSDLVDLKQQYEQDYRAKENALQNKYESLVVQEQTRGENLLNQKDTHIAALLQSVQEYQQRFLMLEERSRISEHDENKRQDNEEKLREAMLTCANLRSNLEATQSQLEKVTSEYATFKQQSEETKSQFETLVHELQEKYSEQSVQSQKLHQELNRRPPLDFRNLANKTGFILGEDKEESCTWPELESFIVDTLRKQGGELIALRLKEGEVGKVLTQSNSTCTELQEKLREKEEEVRELKREVQVAQHANRQARQAYTSYPSATSTPRKTPPTLSAVSADEAERDAALDIAKTLEESLNPSAAPTELVEVLRSQRERLQKNVTVMQSEREELQSKLERLVDEQTQLRNENIELYRRLRVLRVGQGGSGAGGAVGLGSNVGGWGQSTTGDNMRSRRIGKDEEDPLDNKYHALYEEELSPFRVAELDRQVVWGRLGLGERVLAWLNKYVLQDKWMRQAFLCYLALVHVFALFYCMKMLSPELDGEVDEHLRARWSKETFDLPEHPDN